MYLGNHTIIDTWHSSSHSTSPTAIYLPYSTWTHTAPLHPQSPNIANLKCPAPLSYRITSMLSISSYSGPAHVSLKAPTSLQPVMPCIWALDLCAGHQFRRTDSHNHTTTSPIFATAGAPCKTAQFPSWTVNISTYLTTSCIRLFHWIAQ